MPSEYQVEQVIGTQDEWGNDFGRFLPYELKLSGPDAPNAGVVLNRKLKDGSVPDSKVPKQGQTLYLSITENAHGFRAKEEKREQGSQGAQNGAQGDKPDAAYWDARNRSIIRQHSQDMALRMYELLRTEGVLAKAEGNDIEPTFRLISRLADYFDKDVRRAGEKPDETIPF